MIYRISQGVSGKLDCCSVCQWDGFDSALGQWLSDNVENPHKHMLLGFSNVIIHLKLLDYGDELKAKTVRVLNWTQLCSAILIGRHHIINK